MKVSLVMPLGGSGLECPKCGYKDGDAIKKGEGQEVLCPYCSEEWEIK